LLRPNNALPGVRPLPTAGNWEPHDADPKCS
jgi:hypothetical protein